VEGHITVTEGEPGKVTLHCKRCGGVLTLTKPASSDEFPAATGAFVERHGNCLVPRRED